MLEILIFLFLGQGGTRRNSAADPSYYHPPWSFMSRRPFQSLPPPEKTFVSTDDAPRARARPGRSVAVALTPLDRATCFSARYTPSLHPAATTVVLFGF